MLIATLQVTIMANKITKETSGLARVPGSRLKSSLRCPTAPTSMGTWKHTH